MEPATQRRFGLTRAARLRARSAALAPWSAVEDPPPRRPVEPDAAADAASARRRGSAPAAGRRPLVLGALSLGPEPPFSARRPRAPPHSRARSCHASAGCCRRWACSPGSPPRRRAARAPHWWWRPLACPCRSCSRARACLVGAGARAAARHDRARSRVRRRGRARPHGAGAAPAWRPRASSGWRSRRSPPATPAVRRGGRHARARRLAGLARRRRVDALGPLSHRPRSPRRWSGRPLPWRCRCVVRGRFLALDVLAAGVWAAAFAAHVGLGDAAGRRRRARRSRGAAWRALCWRARGGRRSPAGPLRRGARSGRKRPPLGIPWDRHERAPKPGSEARRPRRGRLRPCLQDQRAAGRAGAQAGQGDGGQPDASRSRASTCRTTTECSSRPRTASSSRATSRPCARSSPTTCSSTPRQEGLALTSRPQIEFETDDRLSSASSASRRSCSARPRTRRPAAEPAPSAGDFGHTMVYSPDRAARRAGAAAADARARRCWWRKGKRNVLGGDARGDRPQPRLRHRDGRPERVPPARRAAPGRGRLVRRGPRVHERDQGQRSARRSGRAARRATGLRWASPT